HCELRENSSRRWTFRSSFFPSRERTQFHSRRPSLAVRLFVGFVNVDHVVQLFQMVVFQGVHHAVCDFGLYHARGSAQERGYAALDPCALVGSHGFLLSEVFSSTAFGTASAARASSTPRS